MSEHELTAISNFKKACNPENGVFSLGFIGCGNMAKAIVSGLIKSKLFEGSEIIVSGTRQESLEKWKDLNVKTTLRNEEVVMKSKIIFLCVKPNVLPKVAADLYELKDTDVNFCKKTLVSILAGVSVESLKETFKSHLKNINYIRAMPNTPLMVCAGATAITPVGKPLGDSYMNFEVIKIIFGSLGVVEVVEESKFHAITGLSGSGPAYIYIMIEALSDAGVKQGLPRDLATKFAAQTVYGASKTLLETGIHPGQAKDQVTSAGGTTIYAVHELEKGRIRDTLINAVEAATKRSMELSKQ